MIYQDELDLAALQQYAKALNARARTVRAHGRLSAAALQSRIFESGGRCEWCGVNLVGSPLELDHVISLGQRGSNTPANLAVACPDCNRRKGQKHPARFAMEIFNETRRRTELISRVLAHYHIEASQQLPLFPAQKPAAPSLAVKNQDAAPPHYHWADSAQTDDIFGVTI